MEFIKMGPIGGISYSYITEWDEMGHNEISHIIVTYNKNGVRSIQFGYVDNGALVMSKMYGSSPVGYVDNGSLAMSKMFGSSPVGYVDNGSLAMSKMFGSSPVGYVDNGSLAMLKMFGSSSSSSVGYSTRIVRLKHESEFVTGLSLEIYNNYITSLTFHTNERKHEVFHLAFESKGGEGPEKMELHSGILERREFGGFFGTYRMFGIGLVSIGFYVRLVLRDVKKTKKEKA